MLMVSSEVAGLSSNAGMAVGTTAFGSVSVVREYPEDSRTVKVSGRLRPRPFSRVSTWAGDFRDGSVRRSAFFTFAFLRRKVDTFKITASLGTFAVSDFNVANQFEIYPLSKVSKLVNRVVIGSSIGTLRKPSLVDLTTLMDCLAIRLINRLINTY